MKRKRNLIISLLVGTTLLVLGFLSPGIEQYQAIKGLAIGLGAGILGGSLARLFMNHYYRNHPQELEKMIIEQNDERSTMLQQCAKAKTLKVNGFLLIVFGLSTILPQVSFWITITIVIIYLMNTVMTINFITKLNKEIS